MIVAQVKGLDFPAFSCTREEVEDQTEMRSLVFEGNEPLRYRALKLRHGCLTGVVCLGEWPEAWRVREAVFQNRRISPAQSRLFLASGNLWVENNASAVAHWPKHAVVCNCMGVTKNMLELAVEAGFTSIEALQDETKVGTSCGSCLPFLAELIERPVKLPAVVGARVLIIMAILGLLALAFLSLVPSLPFSDTLQGGWKIDKLWQDSFWKQCSGYTLLVLSSVTLLMSWRKRGSSFRFLSYPAWRQIHTAVGVFALVILAAHTGLALGHHLNLALTIDFLLLASFGSLTSLLIVIEGRSNSALAKGFKAWGYWGHVLLFWPFPILLAFHVLSSYYF
jgi:nitrite reductase (NADH) large subunit